jgi:hypothetical protein
MRKLGIKIFDAAHNCIESIVCEHLDACNSMTILSHSYVQSKIYKKGDPGETYTIPEKINHWNLMDGLITIYYTSGFEMEITRIYD